jgi:hypothetical protein
MASALIRDTPALSVFWVPVNISTAFSFRLLGTPGDYLLVMIALRHPGEKVIYF